MNTRPVVLATRWKGERRDCTVRAFAVAFNIDYEVAHAFLRANGRRLQRKFNMRELLKATTAERIDASIQYVGDVPLLSQECGYIVFARGHAIGWRDGQHSDAGVTSFRGKARIKEVWRVAS